MQSTLDKIDALNEQRSQPRQPDIDKAKETVTLLYEHAGDEWREPLVYFNDDDMEINLEWNIGGRHLWFWFNEDVIKPFGYLISSGPRIFVDMDDGVVANNTHLYQLWDWLLTKEEVLV